MKAKFVTAILILSGLFVTANRSYACNLNPLADLDVFREYVILGKSVTLDGSASYDPDGPEGIGGGLINGIKKFEWDFTDNGSYDYSETSSSYPDGAFDGITTHIYDSNGTYTVRLRVTDNDGSEGGSGDRTDTDTCTVHVRSPDSDNDGLPADWEELYDFNDANFADADQDFDEDGFNNLCEYLHGSEPNDSNSVPDPNFPITIYVPADVNSIQRAINASIDGDMIVVSEGTYYEAIDFNSVSCILTSTDPNDWAVIADTIIDADDPNAYVVTFENSEDANSVLRGFTITGGELGIYCDGASPTISNCVITGNKGGNNYGGGIYDCNSSPTITNCFFSENDANYGGGIYDFNSSPTVVSCVFSKNVADVNGGGMYNYDSSPTVINCTFSGNSADGDGGGMFNCGVSDPNLTNCIFWGNEADGSGDEIYNDANSDPNFRYCDIESCGGSGGGWDHNFGSDDGNNIDIDPNFIDAGDPAGLDGVFGTFDDGLQLRIVSPCIDAADGNAAPSTDITGRGRIDVPYIDDHNGVGDPNYADIGAYESPVIWFVDDSATGNNDGSSWEDAFIDLQDALAGANDGDEIWVAEGTYRPTDGNDRSISFQLVQGVAVYGGFAGTEIGRHQRNWRAHKTILSGDIGTQNDQSDNSYNVVKGADNAVLDGFTITGGNANGSGSWPNYNGGGIYCYYQSPTINNCTITGNNASGYGGGMYSRFYAPRLTNCSFSGNEANFGGGIFNRGSVLTLTNCIFSSNEASSGGGCMYNDYTYSNGMMVVNSTFSGNDAQGRCGGVYNYRSSPTFMNCIFWANTDEGIYNNWSYPTVSYCDIEDCGGSGGGWDHNFGPDGGGNIDSDPCFLDVNNPAGTDAVFGTYDDGLRLRGGSPCIDAADGDAAPSEDILGLGRVDVGGVNNTGTGNPNYTDIGCYESYSGYGSDTDGDGLWDYEEYLLGTDPDDWDSDDDGLSDGNEFNVHHTNPLLSDTDSDGMPDGWEVNKGFDPLDSGDASEDADNDGLSNLGEYTNNADPHDKDTDNDYMLDGWEVDNWLDPNSDTGNHGANGNPDTDDYVNLSEYLHGSDPNDVNNIPESTTTITVPTEVGSIQWAINVSISGDVIEVLRGEYYESINFNDWAVTLRSTDPNDWWVVESTIIDGNEANKVVVFDSGEDANSVLTGLRLTNGEYGISCSSSSRPTITRCIIEDNNSHGIYCTLGSPLITNNMIGFNGGDGIYVYDANSVPTIKNNWIYENESDGIAFDDANSDSMVRNNTIVKNTSNGIYVGSVNDPNISNCILWDNADDVNGCSATYSCIKDGDAGTGNISSNPQFIDDPDVDCRIQRTSPCINAGDPNATYSGEKDIENEVREAKTVDMGADEVCEVHNTTQDTWYSGVDSEGIQDAIDDANDGDVIKVYEWTFYESIVFDGNLITVRSTDPNDWDVVECTIINANNPDANVVTFDPSGDANSVLRGFTLTGGKNGVYCNNSSSPVIRNCIITGNDSAGVACISGSPIITCCKIGENSEDGIYSSSTTPPTIKSNLIHKNAKGISFTSATSVATIRNNTIVDNEDYGISVSGTEPNVSNCIVWGHDNNDLNGCSATYSCIQDVNDANGIGNISSDPMFVNANSNNYCLDSSSPCLDAGDPNQTYTGEHGLYGKILDWDEDGIVTQGSIPIYVICVKKDSPNPGGGDGETYNTWETAYHELRDALTPALAGGTEIWAAQGIYTPAERFSNDRLAAFQIGVDVTIKGGYAGSATVPDFRDIALYETIMSGDIDGDDDSSGDNGENSYHVVTGADGATLDGFTITGGNANGEGESGDGGGMYNDMCTPTVRNCTFRNNYALKDGGGMSNVGAPSTPALTKCTFENNTAGGNGGAIDNWRAVPDIDSCVFVDNSAAAGGSIFNNANYSGCITITNCVFYNNSAITSGGSLYNYLIINNNIPKVTNCTFHKNTATYGNSVRNIFSYKPIITNCIMWNDDGKGYEVNNCNWSDPTITCCDIKDCRDEYDEWDPHFGTDGGGNIDTDPKFVDSVNPAGPPGPIPPKGDDVYGTFDDGLRIKFHSPCVDAATSTGAPSTDVLGLNRVDIRAVTDSGTGTYPDMGAYEAVVEHVIFISVDGLGSYPTYLGTLITDGDVPNMKGHFIDNGMWTDNARAEYLYTKTIPGHTTMVTGRPVDKPVTVPEWPNSTTHHGWEYNSGYSGYTPPRNEWMLHGYYQYSTSPEKWTGNENNVVTHTLYMASPFDIVHDRGMSTALYANKEKFEVFERSYNATYGREDQVPPYIDGKDKISYYENNTSTNPSTLIGYLETRGMDNFVFFHFRGPDSAGHASGWGNTGWDNAVKLVDDYLLKIFDMVEKTINKDKACYYNTVVIMTADHGGYGTTHGPHPDYLQECQLPFGVWGHLVPKGVDAYDYCDSSRTDPGGERGSNYNTTYTNQPIRHADGVDLGLSLMGLPAIDGALIKGMKISQP